MCHIKEFSIVVTAKGYPAIWESGGRDTFGGSSTIICGQNAEKLQAITTLRDRNGRHALFIVRPGLIIVNVTKEYFETNIGIYKIMEVDIKSRFAIGKKINSCQSLFKWDVPLLKCFEPVVDAAIEVARTYNCNEYMWAIPPYKYHQEDTVQDMNDRSRIIE